jgi:hypothetical protein
MKHILPTDTYMIMKSLIVYPALLMLMAACGGKTAETKKPVTMLFPLSLRPLTP